MMIIRQSCLFSLKAFLPKINGNVNSRSGDKSLIREPIILKKSGRATLAMISITKLIRNSNPVKGDKFNMIGKILSLAWNLSRMYEVSQVTAKCYFYSKLISQRSKARHDGTIGTMGNPKSRKTHGFGILVVDANRRGVGNRFLTTSININPNGVVILKELREKNKSIVSNPKVIHIIANLNILITAYEKLKSRPGNMTPTKASKLTLDRLDLKFLKKTSYELLAGKYSFFLAKRKYIPKSGKEKLRLLEIANPGDIIVQTTLLTVLEAIYENSFSDNSHGFRPGKGCHTALKSLKMKFGGCIWAIKGDISKCYDTINHYRLMEILRERISCDKTLALIKKSFKNPYKDGLNITYPKIGIFQGNSLSPILCNIYLDKLDSFMHSLKKLYDKGKQRKKNPEYRRIQYALSKPCTILEKRRLSKTLRSLNSKLSNDSSFRRLQYIRYADDFVVGIIGPREDAVLIRTKIKDFLQESLSLNLNLSETKISHFNKQGIHFLETDIKGSQENEKVVRTVIRDEKSYKTRTTSNPFLKAPIQLLLKKAFEVGFFKKTKKGMFVPTSYKRAVNLDHSSILKFYNFKIQGILNYYSFADNRKSLGIVIHGLKHSCALTLALKFKFRRRAQVFKKFGNYLKCKETGTELYIPKTFARTQEFSINPRSIESFLNSKWNNKLTRSNLFKSCLICGKSSSKIHHVQKIKDLKAKYFNSKIDFWTKQMTAINRKQVPLCKSHYKALNHNQLTPVERSKLKKAISEMKD